LSENEPTPSTGCATRSHSPRTSAQLQILRECRLPSLCEGPLYQSEDRQADGWRSSSACPPGPRSSRIIPTGFTTLSTTGCRLRVDRVRLITRGDYDRTRRYPWIVEAARKIPAVAVRARRRSRVARRGRLFRLQRVALRQARRRSAILLFLAEGDDDLRKLPLHFRKTNLERLLARRPEGIFVNPFERGEIGPDLFAAACRMGLEGLVSKRRHEPDDGRFRLIATYC